MMSTSCPGPTTSGGGARQGPTPFDLSKKRKERDEAQSLPVVGFQPPRRPQRAEPQAERKPAASPAKSPTGNRLLAGYLAHEYLTRGTLFGKPFNPKPEREQLPAPPRPPASASASASAAGQMPSPYANVSRLLFQGDSGVHIQGVVNPTQLARWLQMQ